VCASGGSGCTPRGRVHCNDAGQSTEFLYRCEPTTVAQLSPSLRTGLTRFWQRVTRQAGETSHPGGWKFPGALPKGHLRLYGPLSLVLQSHRRRLPRLQRRARCRENSSEEEHTHRFRSDQPFSGQYWLLALFSMSSDDAAPIVRRRRTGEKSLSRLRDSDSDLQPTAGG
jgi:hypothetical protein